MTDDQSPLADGTYDGLIVDADDRDDGTVHLDITIVAGERKGEVVEIGAGNLAVDAIDLLGMPVTVTVADGRPSVTIDD